jgi:hypothetical protein
VFDFPVQTIQSVAVSGEQKNIDIVIRPQDIIPGVDGQDGLLTCQAEVMLRDDLGSEVIVYLDVEGISLITILSHEKDSLISEDVVTIGIQPSTVVLFAPDTGQRIGHGAG